MFLRSGRRDINVKYSVTFILNVGVFENSPKRVAASYSHRHRLTTYGGKDASRTFAQPNWRRPWPRMYTLRNQLIHGGATWNSRVNRDQLRDCSAFLGKLVPYIIQLMMDNPNVLWGDACYPVVEAD